MTYALVYWKVLRVFCKINVGFKIAVERFSYNNLCKLCMRVFINVIFANLVPFGIWNYRLIQYENNHKGTIHEDILQWFNIRRRNPHPIFKYAAQNYWLVLTGYAENRSIRFYEMSPESVAITQNTLSQVSFCGRTRLWQTIQPNSIVKRFG